MAHILIVEARFYPHLNDMLLAGARAAIEAAGHEHETITVPGALEIPGAIALAAKSGRYCGFVALGAPDAIGPGSIFQPQPTPFLGNCDPTRASTPHAAGIQVGLADGSVRTLAPSISGTTWWAAVTPADGEVLGSDW